MKSITTLSCLVLSTYCVGATDTNSPQTREARHLGSVGRLLQAMDGEIESDEKSKRSAVQSGEQSNGGGSGSGSNNVSSEGVTRGDYATVKCQKDNSRTEWKKVEGPASSKSGRYEKKCLGNHGTKYKDIRTMSDMRKGKLADTYNKDEMKKELGNSLGDVVITSLQFIPTGIDENVQADACLEQVAAQAKLWEHGGAEASASFCKAEASASTNGWTASASASASVAEASAKASLLDGIIEASAEASFCKASASAKATPLGVEASADAHVAKASAGIENTPLQVSATAVDANANAGCSLNYIGAEAGASLAEAKAGPFALRVGVKVGVSIENGIPKADLGPVSVPCVCM